MHDIDKPITLEDLTNPDKTNFLMKSFERKDSLLKNEAALKKNLKKERKFKIEKKEKMTVLSDKWIKNLATKKGMIKPFVNKQVRKEKFHLAYLLMDTTQEFLMNLKFLQT